MYVHLYTIQMVPYCCRYDLSRSQAFRIQIQRNISSSQVWHGRRTETPRWNDVHNNRRARKSEIALYAQFIATVIDSISLLAFTASVGFLFFGYSLLFFNGVEGEHNPICHFRRVYGLPLNIILIFNLCCLQILLL